VRKLQAVLAAAVIAASGAATAAPLEATLIAHNQRSGDTVSTLVWNGGNAFSAWGVVVGVEASNATWTWDPSTQTLASSGLFWTTSHIGSNPFGLAVISDKVVDLNIDTINNITTATSYECVEGNFLAGVGAHGCANVNTGANFQYESVMTYNVMGNAAWITRDLNANPCSPDFPPCAASQGDDFPLDGEPRGLTTIAAGPNNDAAAGAFDLFNVVVFEPWGDDSGDWRLILGNQATLAESTNFLTFRVVPVPAAVWLFASALGLLGWMRRRSAIA
jgi:hypothetical protein